MIAGKEVTIIIRLASVLFAQLQVILRFKTEIIKAELQPIRCIV
jgi:hypothetical protein